MKLHGIIILSILCVAAPANAKRVHAYVVVDVQNKRILAKKNANDSCHPASLTKKMTLYLLFDALKKGIVRLDTKFRISEHAVSQRPSKLGLSAGESISVRKVIEALVVKSANDAAVVAAEGLAGSEEAFVTRMNETARSLKMYNTHFENASGIQHPKQVTTAKDMARLAISLLRAFPEFASIFALRTFKYNGNTYYTHNHLLNTLQGSNGIKTGYVDASGYNVSASIIRYDESHNPVHLVCVVMGHESPIKRDQEVIDLVEPILIKRKAFFYKAVNPQDAGKNFASQTATKSVWGRAAVRTKDGTKLLLEQFEQRHSMSAYLNAFTTARLKRGRVPF
ncbi:MAG: D-alanyl-D-alanine carboxypeptidase [Holosporales bacterium]|jgi:D-alanyl-D-alanine carboxypeptidase|nr:D-alanyl-D-alanine carboxypeptidase [Holosporales bacterium]